MTSVRIRSGVERDYADVFTAAAKDALHALAPLDDERKALMRVRSERRRQRARDGERIGFLSPSGLVPGTGMTVQDARRGAFAGSDIPAD